MTHVDLRLVQKSLPIGFPHKLKMAKMLLLFFSLGGSNHLNERNKWAFSFNVADLRSVTVKREGWSYLIFCLRDDTTLPAIHFHQGDSQAFLDGLRKSVQLSE